MADRYHAQFSTNFPRAGTDNLSEAESVINPITDSCGSLISFVSYNNYRVMSFSLIDEGKHNLQLFLDMSSLSADIY